MIVKPLASGRMMIQNGGGRRGSLFIFGDCKVFVVSKVWPRPSRAATEPGWCASSAAAGKLLVGAPVSLTAVGKL